MAEQPLLTAKDAARLLGVSTPTFYAWLGLSDVGQLVIRGHSVVVSYHQTGARGQGKILISAAEVDRLLDLMRVVPQARARRLPTQPTGRYPGVTVPLGRPP